MNDQTRKTAEEWTKAGASVFLALPGQKINTEPGGFNNSFTTVAELEKWTEEHPRYKNGNLGVDLDKSPFIVVDIDQHGETNGRSNFIKWSKAQGVEIAELTEQAYTETTATGGLHFIYKWDSDRPKPVAEIKALPGVDLLTNKRGLIVAPSETPDGNYKHINDITPTTTENAPEWIEKLAKAKDNDSASKGAVYATKNSFTRNKVQHGKYLAMILHGLGDQGGRNENLYKLSCSLLEYLFDPMDAKEFAIMANENTATPLPYLELEKTFDSAVRTKLRGKGVH